MQRGMVLLLIGLLLTVPGYAARLASPHQLRVAESSPQLVVQLEPAYYGEVLRVTGDGKHLLNSAGGAARIWKLETGELLHTFPDDGRPALSADGTLLATCVGGRVRLWEVPSGRLLQTHTVTEGLHRLAFAGSRLVHMFETGRVHSWDTRSGEDAGRFAITPWPDASLALATHGELLAVGAGPIQVWNTRERRELRAFAPPGTQTHSLAFSPDGKLLASAHLWGLEVPGVKGACLWDVGTGRLLATLPGADGPLAFSPDGRYLATGHGWDEAQIWDVEHQMLVRSVSLAQGPRALAFEPSGRLIAAVGNELIAIDPGRDQPVKLRTSTTGHHLTRLAASPDGRWLAVGDTYDRVYLWDLERPAFSRSLGGLQGRIEKLAFSPDGTRLAGLVTRFSYHNAAPGWVKIWRTADWTLERTIEQPELWGTDLAFSPNGRSLVVANRKAPRGSGSTPSRLLFWELATGKPGQPWNSPQNILRAAFAPDGKTIASGTLKGRVRLQEVKSAVSRWTFTGGADDSVAGLAYTPDGRHIAVGGSEGILRIWDVRTGEPKTVARNLHEIQSLACSSSGVLAATNEGGSILVHEPGWNGVRTIPAAHLGVAEACIWLPQRGHLASAGEDFAVRIWDRRNYRLRATLQMLPSAAQEAPPGEWIIYTPDGFYGGSPRAERRIRWRLDGQLYPAAQYAARFRSHEAVRRTLTGE